MSFPTSPAIGQKYKDYIYTGSMWDINDNVELELVQATKTPCYQGINSVINQVLDGCFKPTTTNINIGNHFNTNTGLFTAPITGTYICIFDALIRTSAAVTAYAYVYFEKNGAEASGWNHTMHDITRDYEPLALSAVVYAEAGDTIGCHINTIGGASMYNTSYARLGINFIG